MTATEIDIKRLKEIERNFKMIDNQISLLSDGLKNKILDQEGEYTLNHCIRFGKSAINDLLNNKY